jgi:phage shock protein C
VNPRRLYRSRNDKQLAGVAAGMAEYLDLDPTLVRILWILSVFLGGFTILLYVILAFVIPLAPAVPAGPSWGPQGGWGPSGTWAPGGPSTPGGAPVPGASTAEGSPGMSPTEGTAATPADATGNADGEPGADANPTEGWNAAQAGWTDPAWTGTQGWSAPAPVPATARRRGPGAAVYAGVVLVVFGVIALADSVIPGLAGITLAPALLVALGAALLIGSMRRTTNAA